MTKENYWMKPKPNRIKGESATCPACGATMCVIDDNGFTKCPNEDDPRTVLRRLIGLKW